MSTISRKRSRSEMDGTHSTSHDIDLSLSSRDHIYTMHVLSLQSGQTEDELDQQCLLTATGLGIVLPQELPPAVDFVAEDLSELRIYPDAPELYPDHPRQSVSTQSRSSSSSEGHPSPTKASSRTTGSIQSAPPSVRSFSSKPSPYIKIRKGLRRLSTFHRKRRPSNVGSQAPTPAVSALTESPAQSAGRPSSTTFVQSIDESAATYDSIRQTIHKSPVVRPRTIAITYLQPVRTIENDVSLAARERSMKCIKLQKLQQHQREEQGRFIRFENQQCSLIMSKKAYSKKNLLESHVIAQEHLVETHAQALVSLEHRHLAAEVELVRTLALERKSCETSLKYMEAYCSDRPPPDGMPRRKITESDYRKLAQQYHTRNCMENLHEARINVLREKQAKQLERVAAKQEAQLEKAEIELNQRLDNHDTEYNLEEEDLRQEFLERKRRLVARWTLIEAIERRKLEDETGEPHDPLPPLEWPEPSTF